MFQEGFALIPDRGTNPSHCEPSPAPYLLWPSLHRSGLYLPARWISLLKPGIVESSGGPHLPEKPRRSKELRFPVGREVLQKQVCMSMTFLLNSCLKFHGGSLQSVQARWCDERFSISPASCLPPGSPPVLLPSIPSRFQTVGTVFSSKNPQSLLL